MKSKSLLLLLLPVAAIVTVVAQGPLTPPGAPAPVLKTLDQMEPRTPVSSLPLTISQPGSYYFTRNLQFTATEGHAISIDADNVTLDLRGFTLSSKAPVTGNAITLSAGLRNIEVRNGNIDGNTVVSVRGTVPNQTWTAVRAGFTRGIVTRDAFFCHLHDLRIAGCKGDGIDGGEMMNVDRVTVAHCGGSGIIIQSGTVSNCVVELIEGAGGSSGIYVATGGTVSCCTVISTGSHGIRAGYSSVNGCAAHRNGGGGITAYEGSVTNSVANGNGGIGIQANAGSITNCTSTFNGSHGIFGPEGTITSCAARGNVADGIAGNTGVVGFCRAIGNNTGGGATDIDGAGATRTGNNPAP